MLSTSMESLLQKMGKDELNQEVIHEDYMMITAVYRELASHHTSQPTLLEFKLILDYLVVLESIAGKMILTTAEQQEREHLSTLLLNKLIQFPITSTEKNKVIFQELTGCSAVASPLGELAERLNRLILLDKIRKTMDVDEQKYLRQIENQMIDQLVICMHKVVHNQALDSRQKEELLAKALANKKIKQRFHRTEEKNVAQQKNEIQELIAVLEHAVSKPLPADELKRTVTALETLLTEAHEKAGTESSWTMSEIATLLHAAGAVYMQLGETEKALHRVEQAAEGGNSMARYYLVSCYKQGKYPYIDLNKLIMWCEECYLDTNLGLPAFNNIIEALDQIGELDDSDRVMNLLKSVKAKSKLLSIKNAIHSKIAGHKLSLFSKEHKEHISENTQKIMGLIKEAEKKNTWLETVPLVTALLDEGNKKSKSTFADHAPQKHYSSLYTKIEKKPTSPANDHQMISAKPKIK